MKPGDQRAIRGRRFRFGVFEFDRESLELFRRGRKLPLPPQPARTLDLLLRRPGRLVSREELRDHIWGEGTHVDFDASLNRCIRQIRAALGDDAVSARFLETLPRRGYRFLATVERVEPGAPAASTANAVPSSAQPLGQAARHGKRWLLAMPLALLIVGTLVSLGVRSLHLENDSVPSPLAATSEEARRAFLRGTYLLDRFRLGGEPTAAEAAAELQRAVDLDPLLAPAYAELAWARSFEDTGTETMELARSLAELALELDEGQASAHRLLGRLSMYRDFDWRAAEHSLGRAVELAPGEAASHHGLAFYFSALGLHDRAISSIEHALELDPASVVVRGDVATVYYRARRFERASEHLRLALELQPSYLPALRGRVLNDLAWGRRTEAVSSARALMETLGTDPAGRTETHDPSEALETFWRWYVETVEALLQSHPGQLSTADLALGLVALGWADEAVEALETAVEQRDSPLLAALAVDPAFDPLRDHPRFARLLERLGLERVELASG